MDFPKIIYKNLKKKKKKFISQETYLYTHVSDILKFFEVLLCTWSCKSLFCLLKTVIMLIFLRICIMSKLHFPKNCWMS